MILDDRYIDSWQIRNGSGNGPWAQSQFTTQRGSLAVYMPNHFVVDPYLMARMDRKAPAFLCERVSQYCTVLGSDHLVEGGTFFTIPMLSYCLRCGSWPDNQ